MVKLLESRSNSETSSKSRQTSSEDCFISDLPDWTELPSRSTNNTTFTSGYSQEGMANIRISEYEEDEWAVVYNLVTEGGSEPVSNILGDEKPGFLSFDLPYNMFDEKENAVEYAETLMQIDLEDMFREYGLRMDPYR